MIKTYTIKIDNLYISGLSDDFHDFRDIHNKGFHYSNKCGINKFLFSKNKKNAIRIIGLKNLHSWIDKLHTRIDGGFILANKIIIEAEK